jgi:GT2 family glycosyltransferase
MPAPEPAVDAPRVTAILVACNGANWLPHVLAHLRRLRYPALEIVAVDNASTDASADLLRAELGEEHVVVLERNAGFGRAVAAALAHFEAAQQADYLLLMHDDLVLAPNALRRMARALLTDPSLSIVGPKLREWKHERVLQQVGMTIDRVGRAESRLDPEELDQGQHDRQREVLYVSTAGMLLRRDVLARVGGFDARFPAFRDDLDLCWRAWLAGLRVEVVPQAVGYHVGAPRRAAKLAGSGRRWESRFLAERHSIATLLKNYGLLRLLWVLPAVALLGASKALAFVASRRFGDALATVLAWVWNLFQVPKTLRRRREAQRRRVVSDGELLRLFAPGLPRLREYKEALASWLAGGSTRALIDERDQPLDALDGASGLRSALRTLREHAAATVGVVLLVGYLVGAAALLGGGQILGGEVARWPAEASGSRPRTAIR